MFVNTPQAGEKKGPSPRTRGKGLEAPAQKPKEKVKKLSAFKRPLLR